MITNFVSNAIKFTHRGTITIGYQIDAARQLEMFVEDTGIGISAENQTAVFDRFMKVDSFVQGTGLGLLCARALSKRWADVSASLPNLEGLTLLVYASSFFLIPTR